MKRHAVTWFLILVFMAGLALGFANYRLVTFSFLFAEREYHLANLLAWSLSVGFLLGIVAGLAFRRCEKKGVVLNLASDRSHLTSPPLPSRKINSMVAVREQSQWLEKRLSLP